MVSQVLVVALAAFSIIISNGIFSECARHVVGEIALSPYGKSLMQLTIHGIADRGGFIAIPLPAEYRTPSIDQMKMMMSVFDNRQFKEGVVTFCEGIANGYRRVLIFPCEPSVDDLTVNYSADWVRMFLQISPMNFSGPIVICYTLFLLEILYRRPQGFDPPIRRIINRGADYSEYIDEAVHRKYSITEQTKKPIRPEEAEESEESEEGLESEIPIRAENVYNSEETRNTECSIISKEMMIEIFMEMIDNNENKSLASEMLQHPDFVSHSEPPTFSINNATSNVTIRVPNSDFSKMFMTIDDASSYIQKLCPDQAVELMQHVTSLLRERVVPGSSSNRTLNPGEDGKRLMSVLLNN